MKSTKTNTKKVQSIDWKSLIADTLTLEGLRKTVETKDKNLSYRYAEILVGKMKEKGETLTSAKVWFMPQIRKAMTSSQREAKEGTIRSQLGRASILVPYLESGLQLEEPPTMEQCKTIHRWNGLPLDEIRGEHFRDDFNHLKDEVTPTVVEALADAMGGADKVGVPKMSFIWDEISRFVAKPRVTASALEQAKTAWSEFAQAYGKLDANDRHLFEQHKKNVKLVTL